MCIRNLKRLIKIGTIVATLGVALGYASTPTIYAVGAYYKSGFSQDPVILKSDNLGEQWSNVPLNMNNNWGWVNQGTCTQQFCLAIGDYHDNKYVLSPLVLQSHDKGQTWDMRHFSDDSDTTISRVYCDSQQCVVSYSSPSSEFIATSNDGAHSWLKTKLSEDVSLKQLDCNNSLCIGVGQKGTENKKTIPYLTVSQDNGLHWDGVDLVNIEGWPKDFPYGGIRGEKCLFDRCFLVGDMYNNQSNAKGFIIVGKDDNRWVMQNLPQSNNHSNWFESISCSSKVCIAIGNGDREPFIYASYDQGENWQLISLANEFVDSTFSAVHCSENICMIVGLKANKTLVLVSNDAGHTWELVDIKHRSSHDYFSQVKCQDSVCIMNGITERGRNRMPVLAVYNSENQSFQLKIFNDKGVSFNINDIFFAAD